MIAETLIIDYTNDFPENWPQSQVKNFKIFIKKILVDELSLLSPIFQIMPERIIFNFSKVLNKTEQATFQTLKSTVNELYFTIPIHQLDTYMEDSTKSINQFKRVIHHELVHASDLTTLKENHEIYQSEIKFNNRFSLNQVSANIERAASLNIGYSVQWSFLQFIASIRNEGIPLLSERLFGYSHDGNSNTLLNCFKDDVDFALNFCSKQFFHNRFSKKQLDGFFGYLNQRLYSYADIVLLQLISSKMEGRLDLELKKLSKLDDSLKFEMLRMAIDMDVSDWIREVLFGQTSIFHQGIDREKIFQFCKLIEGKNAQMSEDLMKLGYNSNADSFLRLIHSQIIKVVSIEEIESRMNSMTSGNFESDLGQDVIYLANQLLRSVNSNSLPVINASLNYLLQKEDYISDNISFLGLQDDWMVLDGAALLVINNH